MLCQKAKGIGLPRYTEEVSLDNLDADNLAEMAFYGVLSICEHEMPVLVEYRIGRYHPIVENIYSGEKVINYLESIKNA